MADFSLSTLPAERPPSGLERSSRTRGEWRLKGVDVLQPRQYVELHEDLDTVQSHPEPALGYEYLIHLPIPGGRNVSFHKDPHKQDPALLYHWHDYPNGDHRSEPVPISYISLRWFLVAAATLFSSPQLSVPDLLSRLPPPGPGDPW